MLLCIISLDIYCRPVAAYANTTSELTRVTRAYPNSSKKNKGGYEGGYQAGGYEEKRSGYAYTTPAPVARETTEENDSDFVTPPRPVGQDFAASARTTVRLSPDFRLFILCPSKVRDFHQNANISSKSLLV